MCFYILITTISLENYILTRTVSVPKRDGNIDSAKVWLKKSYKKYQKGKKIQLTLKTQ